MSNSYFKFKNFTIHHDLCAMKVGADGVTLGAWADTNNVKSILDIGTGSGLIALMLAQRCDKAQIDAIDIDESAIKQAQINFNNSFWKNRINIFHLSLQDFVHSTRNKYDLVISNPPYFQNSLKSDNFKRNTARHTDSLSHKELIDNSKLLLNTNGKLCLILPILEGEQCTEYAESQGLYCLKKVFVFPNPHLEPKRLLLEYSFQKQDCIVSKLTIETNERHVYTPEYTRLVKNFYLKL